MGQGHAEGGGAGGDPDGGIGDQQVEVCPVQGGRKRGLAGEESGGTAKRQCAVRFGRGELEAEPAVEQDEIVVHAPVEAIGLGIEAETTGIEIITDRDSEEIGGGGHADGELPGARDGLKAGERAGDLKGGGEAQASEWKRAARGGGDLE